MPRNPFGPSPKKDPPCRGGPPKCPGCGMIDNPTETKKTFQDEESGAVEGDIVCAECGETLIQGILVSEPDGV